jgi:hypothetical protein
MGRRAFSVTIVEASWFGRELFSLRRHDRIMILRQRAGKTVN